MSLRESAALLVLLRTARDSWTEYAELIEDQGAVAALEHHRERRTPQITFFDEDLRGPLESELADAAREIAAWGEQGIQLLTTRDAGYPQNLVACHDRPPMIFVAGRLRPVDLHAVAVIGARRASPEGVATANAVSTHLVRGGYTVVSGLAAGIDSAAHTAAMDIEGRTIAVIGTGVNRCYPPENAILQQRITAQGAVVSQFLPDAMPTRQRFRMRNAVMSGMAIATVIVEASNTSGARLQARLARAQGRPIFLFESLLSQSWAREFARAPGTYVVQRYEDITAVLDRLAASKPLTA